MFEQVTLLLSFVYALALAHLLSSITGLILKRDQVRFYGPLALWMGFALLAVFNNWLALEGLKDRSHWSVAQEAMEFAGAVIQYFSCSLIAISAEGRDGLDMKAFYDRQRFAFLGANMATFLMVMLLNYTDAKPGSSDWIEADLLDAPAILLVAIAAFARQDWLRWLAGAAILAEAISFLLIYPS